MALIDFIPQGWLQCAPGNMNIFARSLMASELGPEVAEEHQIAAYPSAASMHVVLDCSCGWSARISAADVLHAGERNFADKLGLLLSEYVEQIRALYQPTLADFTDWGWFHAEPREAA